MILMYVGILIVIFFISVLFILGGFFFYSLFFKDKYNFAFKISFSYFFGLCLFLIFLRLLSELFKFNFALLITIIAFVFLGYFGLKKINYLGLTNLKNKEKFFLFALFLFCLIFVGLYWWNNQWQGSLHCYRYAKISEFIASEQIIPTLNQNYGQSILASIPFSLGFNNPFISLSLWLSFSLFFLILFSYGFLRTLKISKKFSYFGVLILIFANTALSFAYVGILDSGSPLLINGYTDTLTSVVTFFIFIFCLNLYYKQKLNFLHLLFISSILNFSWNLYAPQNILFSAGVVFLVGIYSLYKKRNNSRNLILLLLVIILSALLGSYFGGMFAPRDQIDFLPGVLEVPDSNLRLAPILPYQYPSISGHETNHSLSLYPPIINIYEEGLSIKKEKIPGIFFLVELIFWDSLKIIFFPLLGLFLLFYISNKKNSKSNNLKFLSHSFILIFIMGFFVAYFFLFGSKKWELSRFLINGCYAGFLGGVIYLDYILKTINKKRIKYLILIILSVLLFFGPFYELFLRFT